MAYRILARLDDRALRITLRPGRNVIGSDPACEVAIPNPTVSRRHGAVTVGADGVELEDLGSTNGTLLRSRRIDRARIQPGEMFVVGRVVLVLEEVADEDLEVGIGVDRGTTTPARRPPPAERKERTESFSPLDRFTLEVLPRLLESLERDADSQSFAQTMGFALSETLPVTALEVVETAGPAKGVLYATDRLELDEDDSSGVVGWVEASIGSSQVRVRFFREELAMYYRPIVEIAARLLSLSGRASGVARPAPARPFVPGAATRPEPPSVEPEVVAIYDQAERVARGDVGVMIFGESGTGKEVLAQFIHQASPRAGGAFVAINCASLPRDLLEAELFGVEKGVATGVEARAGKFEAADQGTLFLDEIGDMAAETQAKILRVLQEKEVYRIGGSTPRPARARILAATNRAIPKMLADGTFRSDLYHRIATWEVELPPLRRRRADIPNLAAHFLSHEAARYGIQVRGISRAALRVLRRFRWEGNIRQLKNEISRAVLFLEDGELLDTSRLSLGLRGERGESSGRNLEAVLESVERDEIGAALAMTDGDTAAAAKILGISRPTLYRRLKVLGLETPGAARALAEAEA